MLVSMTRITRGVVIFAFAIILAISNSYGQSTFIPLNDDYYHLIDRLEIKRGKFSEGFHSNMKPYERQAVVALTDSIAKERNVGLTYVDRATIDYLRQDSREWITTPTLRTDSTGRNLARMGSITTPPRHKRRTFFDHPADLYSLHTDDVDLHVNFATNNYVGSENNTNQALWFTGRGVEIRGMINKKLGFYTFVSDNQGIFPSMSAITWTAITCRGRVWLRKRAVRVWTSYRRAGTLPFGPSKASMCSLGTTAILWAVATAP